MAKQCRPKESCPCSIFLRWRPWCCTSPQPNAKCSFPPLSFCGSGHVLCSRHYLYRGAGTSSLHFPPAPQFCWLQRQHQHQLGMLLLKARNEEISNSNSFSPQAIRLLNSLKKSHEHDTHKDYNAQYLHADNTNTIVFLCAITCCMEWLNKVHFELNSKHDKEFKGIEILKELWVYDNTKYVSLPS